MITIDIPVNSQEPMTRLYQYMQSNRFLCYNSTRGQHKGLYRFMEKYFTELQKYFDLIGYLLMQKDDYFYWKEYRPLTEGEIMREIKHVEKMFLCLDFLVHFDSTVSSNSILRASKIASFVDDNPSALDRLRFLTKNKGDVSAYKLSIELLSLLQEEGIVEMIESKNSGKYKVLSSYAHYIELSKMIKTDKEEFTYEQ